MDGIQIMEKKEILASPEWVTNLLNIFGYITISVMVIFLMVFFSIWFIYAKKKKFIPAKIFCPLILGLCSSLICSIIVTVPVYIYGNVCKVPTGRYEYRAVIEENIAFTYIHENYNVISNEDGIWILEDK